MAKLMLNSKEDIRLAIRRRAQEIAASMSDAELFLSEQFKQYATRLADFILRNHKLYSLHLLFDNSPNSVTAFTDGKSITVNTGNTLAQTPKYLEGRFKVVMGLLFHEISHKLFMDFTVSNKALKTIASGSLYGTFQTNGNADLEQAKAELEKVTASAYAGAIAQLYAELSNIVDDGHDEASMRKAFPGFITESIDTMDEVQWRLTPNLEEFLDKRVSEFNILTALLLEYCLWGGCKYAARTPEVQKYLDIMAQLEPTLDMMLLEDNYKKRWNWLNILVLQIWPHIRQMFPELPQNQAQLQNGAGNSGNPQNAQSGAGSSHNGQNSGNGADQNGGNPGQQSQQGGQGTQQGGSPTPEEIKQALQNAAQTIRESMGLNPAPKNGTGKPVTAAQLSNNAMSPGNAGDAMTMAVAVAEGAATQQVQQELDKAQMDAIRSCNIPLIHESVPVEVNRHNPTNEAAYKRTLTEISPVLRNLVKEMQALLRELNEESVQRHRRFGPLIEATESYRPDNAFFTRKKLPEDLPNMALCVLIDQSGSMNGPKIHYAKRTAILLEQFASQLDIPVMIAGHSTCGRDVVFNIFTDYLSAMTDRDRYSLAGIETHSCNRDGLPIRLCCDMLSKRPERVKLMLILSDGAPNHHGYRGDEAREEIAKTVKEYRHKGILIYGAALDEDKEHIENIYGRNFLDIEDVTKLPKRLVNLVRQQIT